MRSRTSLRGTRHVRRGSSVAPIIARPACALLAYGLCLALERLLPARAVTRWLLPISRLLSIPIKWVSSFVPFALLEVLLLALPLFAVALLLWDKFGPKAAARPEPPEEEGGLFEFLSLALTLFGVMMTMFQVTLGFGYHQVPLAEQLAFPDTAVTAENVAQTAQLLAARAAQTRSDADYTNRTVSGYGRQLRAVYRRLAETYPVYRGYAARPKPALLSVGMSYLGVGGLYSPFTCEAIVSTDCTEPALPFTVAHELSHSLLVAREEEANFSGFLACISSDDAALQYSGYFTGLLYTCTAYYNADPEGYREFLSTLDEGVRSDLAAYSKHVSQYRGWANDLQSDVNDLFLKSNGQKAGVESYGLMVDLLVAWSKTLS